MPNGQPTAQQLHQFWQCVQAAAKSYRVVITPVHKSSLHVLIRAFAELDDEHQPDIELRAPEDENEYYARGISISRFHDDVLKDLRNEIDKILEA
jgi:hypothetical protein